jgi:hypothetical protein
MTDQIQFYPPSPFHVGQEVTYNDMDGVTKRYARVTAVFPNDGSIDNPFACDIDVDGLGTLYNVVGEGREDPGDPGTITSLAMARPSRKSKAHADDDQPVDNAGPANRNVTDVGQPQELPESLKHPQPVVPAPLVNPKEPVDGPGGSV